MTSIGLSVVKLLHFLHERRLSFTLPVRVFALVLGDVGGTLSKSAFSRANERGRVAVGELALGVRNAHSFRQITYHHIGNVTGGSVSMSFTLTVHVDRVGVNRGILEGALAVGSLLHISVQVTSDFPRIRPQLLEQLIAIHEVDEALEALALLVDLLVLTSMQ